MTPLSPDERLVHERAHGIFLARDAAKYWGHKSRAGQLRVERRIVLFRQMADLRPGMRVCEIGCGTGIFTRPLIEQTGASVVGIDISPELLAVARRDVTDPRATFVLGDCMEPESLGIPFGFDAVVTNSVLHHLDVERALAAIHRMLRPGGVFVCSEPNMMNPQIALQKNIPWIKKWAGDSPDETAFFRWQIADRLRTAGFDQVAVTPFDFLHPTVPDALAGIGDRVLRVFERLPGIREIAGSLLITGKKFVL